MRPRSGAPARIVGTPSRSFSSPHGDHCRKLLRGCQWTDAWTGKKFQGGRVVKADAPIEHIPVYVRGDKPELLKLFSPAVQLDAGAESRVLQRHSEIAAGKAAKR